MKPLVRLGEITIFGFIAKPFYLAFKGAILTAWNAAKTDALAEIKAGLPTDADIAEARQALPAPEDEPTKRKNK